MSEECAKIITILTEMLLKGGDFSVDGVEYVFEVFCKNIKVKEAPVTARFAPGFVKSSIDAAIEAAKQPVYIPYKVNKYGNMECTIIPGLLIKELGPNDAIAYGVQDGPNVGKLSINQLLACQANGFKYDKNNTVGSARQCTSDLGQ